MISDSALLTAFIATRDESSFRRIVDRYAPMVHGVAWRKTQNRALAEEVTQTVFTILARKAGALRHTELAGWLHRAAAMETRNAARRERRRGRALDAFTESMIPETNPDPAWNDICPHLDEAMTRLSPAERHVIVLRYFERRSHREIAEATGRSEVTCRKQVQRSLDRLGALLRRRGIATTGSALGVALSGQTLCLPPASAATLTTAALQAVPALTSTTLIIQTLQAMAVTTIIKTAAATAVLAAIPMALLWERNQELENEVRHLRAVAAAPAPVLSFPAKPAAVAENAEPGSSPATVAARSTGSPIGGAEANLLAGLFSGEGFVKIAESQLRQDVARELNRLSLRLGLDADQKEKLRAYLEKKHGRELEAFRKVSEDGLLAKAMRDAKSLTPEELAKIEKLDAETEGVEDMDSFLKSLLSDSQMEEYRKAEVEQHTAKAEEKAQEMITSLGQQLNLTSEQKDKIFAAVAERELAKPVGAAEPDTGNEMKAFAEKAVAEGTELNAETLAAQVTAEDRQHDDLLREILSPEQFAAFEASRHEDEKQSIDLFKAIFPALPGGDASKGK